MAEPFIRHVQLLGFEKRFFPSQHYVYMFMIKWHDLTEKVVYRKYTEMYEFHKALKEMFPIESGDIDKEHRTIPHLPGHVSVLDHHLLGNVPLAEAGDWSTADLCPLVNAMKPLASGRITEKEDLSCSVQIHCNRAAPKWFDGLRSTENRQITLADYCLSLLNLPSKISRCPHIINFFKVRSDDVNPTSSNNGRKPETFLLKQEATKKNVSDITGPIILQSYRVIADYEKNSKSELSVKDGDVVDVVEKTENGWWFCQMKNKRGWVPAAYLEPLDSPDESEEQDPNYEGELHITTKDFTGEMEDELDVKEGETVEVIHKLLDGWWVVRRGSVTGYFPAMYLQKSGDAVSGDRSQIKTKALPPRRGTISNANSIHKLKRKEISQESYRKNSKKYLKARQSTIEVMEAMTIDEEKEEDQSKAQPAIPARPSKELILDRCTENTKLKIQTVT